MAYEGPHPFPLASGGTNATSFTNTDGVVYFDGTRLVDTAVGTAGNVLTSNGAGLAPTFQSVGSGSVTIAGNSGTTTGNSFIFSGGMSGANFTMAAGTMTQNFTFLALPNTTASTPTGTITLNSIPYLSNYGTGGGASNIFMGASSGNLTLTPGTAVRNVGMGDAVLVGLTTGNNNTAIGDISSQSFSTGSFNTAIGAQSLGATVTGSNNIAVGYQAGSNHGLADSSNIDIGNIGAAESNTIRIGTQGAGAGQQNRCFISGITGVTITGNAVLINASGQLGDVVSSVKYKTDINDLPDNLRISELRPVSFRYKTEENQALHYGLIAEEVEKVIPSLVIYDDKKEPYSVAYHELPALLLKEVQSLRKEIEVLKSKVL